MSTQIEVLHKLFLDPEMKRIFVMLMNQMESKGEAAVLDMIRKVIDGKKDQIQIQSMCKSVGCYGCCNGPIMASTIEKEYMDAHIKKNNIQLNRGPKKGGWCKYLDWKTKACLVYDERPLICRNYFVSSDPRKCYDKKTVVNVMDKYNEMMVAAYYTIINQLDSHL